MVGFRRALAARKAHEQRAVRAVADDVGRDPVRHLPFGFPQLCRRHGVEHGAMGLLGRRLEQVDHLGRLDGAHRRYRLGRIDQLEFGQRRHQPLMRAGRQVIEIHPDPALVEPGALERLHQLIDGIFGKLDIGAQIGDPAFRAGQPLLDLANHHERLLVRRQHREGLTRADLADRQHIGAGDIGEILRAHRHQRVQPLGFDELHQCIPVGYKLHNNGPHFAAFRPLPLNAGTISNSFQR